MNLTIHRGAKEIGGTCVELRTDNSRILVDFGIPLVSGQKDTPFETDILNKASIDELKAKGILPSITGLYKNESPSVDGILISHSHLDHYGLLRFIHPDIPVYMSQGAKELVEISGIFTPNKIEKLNIRIIPKNKKINIGEFAVTGYLVDHSAFDALSFLIEANGKKLFYSGDFRGHGRKSVLFKRMLDNPPTNIDYLLMEGSMLGRTGPGGHADETSVERDIEKVLKEKMNIAFLFASSQNIDRLVSVYRACLKTGTTFVIDLYTAYILHRLAGISKRLPQFDWKNIRVKFLKFHADCLAKCDKKLLYRFNQKKIELPEINAQKANILMLMRDNSIFPKIVSNIDDINGISIIYSMWEGYLTDKFKAYCASNGIGIKPIHVSGHATVEDLRKFAEALKPKDLIPIHTFYPEDYTGLFKNVRVLRDGETLAL